MEKLVSNSGFKFNLRRFTLASLCLKHNQRSEECGCHCHTFMNQDAVIGRGLHSSTFQLNLSALYGIGGERRDCVAHVKGVLGGV